MDWLSSIKMKRQSQNYVSLNLATQCVRFYLLASVDQPARWNLSSSSYLVLLPGDIWNSILAREPRFPGKTKSTSSCMLVMIMNPVGHLFNLNLIRASLLIARRSKYFSYIVAKTFLTVVSLNRMSSSPQSKEGNKS